MLVLKGDRLRHNTSLERSAWAHSSRSLRQQIVGLSRRWLHCVAKKPLATKALVAASAVSDSCSPSAPGLHLRILPHCWCGLTRSTGTPRRPAVSSSIHTFSQQTTPCIPTRSSSPDMPTCHIAPLTCSFDFSVSYAPVGRCGCQSLGGFTSEEQPLTP